MLNKKPTLVKKYLIVMMFGLLAACSNNSNQFSISGTLQNTSQDTVYLAHLGLQNIAIVDSAAVAEDGTFSFTYPAESADFYLLRTTPRNYITLVPGPGEVLEVTADIQDLGKTYKVTGSYDSQLLLNMRRELDNSVAKMDSLGEVFRAYIDSANFQQVRSSLNEQSQKIMNNQREFTFRFIKNNLGSLSTMMALYQQIAPRRYVLNPETDLVYFQMVDSALMKNYPELASVKALHRQVQDIEQHIASRKAQANAIVIGMEAPEITLPNPEGQMIALSSLRGKYVLVDFWASWCRPCRIENPNLVAAYNKYHESGFEIYQVSLDKTRDNWIKGIEDDNLAWTQVSDLKFWQSEAAKTYKIQSIPANFLLDKEGKIIAKNLRGDALQAKLSELFD